MSFDLEGASPCKRIRLDPNATTSNEEKEDTIDPSTVLLSNTYFGVLIEYIEILEIFRYVNLINKFSNEFINNQTTETHLKRMIKNEFNSLFLIKSTIFQSNKKIINYITELLKQTNYKNVFEIISLTPKNVSILKFITKHVSITKNIPIQYLAFNKHSKTIINAKLSFVVFIVCVRNL